MTHAWLTAGPPVEIPSNRISGLWAHIGVRLRASALFDSFESLGENCEFGFVQAHHHSTQLGLFRYASTSIDALVAIFDERFRSLRTVKPSDFRVEIRRPHPNAPDENIVVLEALGIEYHGGKLAKNPEPEAFRRKQVARLSLLSRKMVEQIEGNEKIFVFKSRNAASEPDILRLSKAMRRIGPATVLWITPAEGGTPGGVERIGEGLLRGHIDTFAPLTDASAFSKRYWKPVCTNAYRLWRGA